MDVSELDAEDFLDVVWDERESYVDIPSKDNYWMAYYTRWDGKECTPAISSRIQTCVRDDENVYFSVAQFGGYGRHAEDFLPSHWLWADLDEVDPTSITPAPTMAWQSSRGRYQALWRLTKRVGAETHNKLNQALTYKVGADLGGWDLTQVLRLPGTWNHKYGEKHRVEWLWYNEALVYDPKWVWKQVKDHAVPLHRAIPGSATSDRPLPPRVLAMLRVKPDETVKGEKSDRLWELMRLLIEDGRGEDEIYAIVNESAWNKWADYTQPDRRLREDIQRAFEKGRTRRSSSTDVAVGPGDRGVEGTTAPSKDSDLHGTNVGRAKEDERKAWQVGDVRLLEFLAQAFDPPRWMIEGVWTDKAHGIIGGEAKTLKTTFAIAMGIAVASGKEFLGTFPVHSRGPVLMMQEENTPQNVQDVAKKIMYSYGLISSEDVTISDSPRGSIGSTVVNVKFPDDIPFRIANQRGLDLTREECRYGLEERIAQVRPAMVILDPMKEMFGNVDLDKEVEVRPYLKWLRDIRYAYDCAVVLVHHMRKAPANRPAHQMLGSTAFHGWVSSALYFHDDTPKDSNGVKRITVAREFREQAPQRGLKIDLRMGLPGSLLFDTYVGGWNASDQALDVVMQAPNQEMFLSDLGEALGGLGRQATLRRVRGCVMLGERGGKGQERKVIFVRNGNEPSS